jgi:hypothetical protein
MRHLAAPVLLLSSLTFTLPVTAQGKLSEQERYAMAMTAEQASRSVEIKGRFDPLEPTVWLSTEPFIKTKYDTDTFLRAAIDKASGEITYQLYVAGRFQQSMRFNRLTYLINGTLQTGKAQQVNFDVSCDRYGCTHYEDYVITLSRDDLEALANKAPLPSWKARLYGQTVQGTDLTILRNETAGLLEATDRIVAKMKAEAERKENPPTSPAAPPQE